MAYNNTTGVITYTGPSPQLKLEIFLSRNWCRDIQWCSIRLVRVLERQMMFFNSHSRFNGMSQELFLVFQTILQIAYKKLAKGLQTFTSLKQNSKRLCISNRQWWRWFFMAYNSSTGKLHIRDRRRLKPELISPGNWCTE